MTRCTRRPCGAAAGGSLSPSLMSATTCVTAANWTPRRALAPPPSISRIGSFRCCRKTSPIICARSCRAWSALQNPQKHAADVAPAVGVSLQTLYAVYGALKEARDARGALDFRGGEVKARIGTDGRIEGFYAVTRNDAHRLIEECMIAANVEAAVALRLAKVGSLYRVHGQPEDKRVTELQKVLNALQVGAVFSEKPTPREFRQLVERLAARPDGLMLESLVIRSMAQAVYQQTNIGHFGLALEEYAHFTSPIRRYPDL